MLPLSSHPHPPTLRSPHPPRQLQELESRFNEAYTQSLTTKDDRIAVLEKRADDMKLENELLKDEISTLRKQLNQIRSPIGSPVTGMS